MLKLSIHSFPHQDKMRLWEWDETQAPTPTPSLPRHEGALRLGQGPPLPHQDSMEPEDADEAQAQHPPLPPPRPERALGRGCGTAPSPSEQKRARGDAPKSQAHVQAGALRDLHGGSPGAARGGGDLARSGAGNAPVAGHQGGAVSERCRQLPTGRSRPPAGLPATLSPQGGPTATSHTERPRPGEAPRSPPPRPGGERRSPSQ